MVCLHCQQEITGKRKDARFCSTRCRVAYNRNAKPVTDSRNMQVVTDTPPAAPQLSPDARERLRNHLQSYNKEALIAEVLAYFEDCEQLRVRNYDLQARLLKQYELIQITTDVGTPDQRTMKIVAPR